MIDLTAASKRKLADIYDDGEPILDPLERDSRVEEISNLPVRRGKEAKKLRISNGSSSDTDGRTNLRSRKAYDQTRGAGRRKHSVESHGKESDGDTDRERSRALQKELKERLKEELREELKTLREAGAVDDNEDEDEPEVFPDYARSAALTGLHPDLFEVEDYREELKNPEGEHDNQSTDARLLGSRIEGILPYDEETTAGLQALYFPVSSIDLEQKATGFIAHNSGRLYEKKCLQCAAPSHTSSSCPSKGLFALNCLGTGLDAGTAASRTEPGGVNFDAGIACQHCGDAEHMGIVCPFVFAALLKHPLPISLCHDTHMGIDTSTPSQDEHLLSPARIQASCHRCFAVTHFGDDCSLPPRYHLERTLVMSSKWYPGLFTAESFETSPPPCDSVRSRGRAPSTIPSIKDTIRLRKREQLEADHDVSSDLKGTFLHPTRIPAIAKRSKENGIKVKEPRTQTRSEPFDILSTRRAKINLRLHDVPGRREDADLAIKKPASFSAIGAQEDFIPLTESKGQSRFKPDGSRPHKHDARDAIAGTKPVNGFQQRTGRASGRSSTKEAKKPKAKKTKVKDSRSSGKAATKSTNENRRDSHRKLKRKDR